MVRGPTKDKVLRRDALPVPENLPTKTRCIQMVIPDDMEYLMQFKSIVYLLGKWNSYQQDGGHKAADVAQLWRDVLFNNPIQLCETGESSGVEIEDMSRFRIDPDNCAIIQIECQPNEWEQFYPPKGCNVPGPTQEGPGGDGPEPGQSRDFCTSLAGNSGYLLPIAVSGGDIITVSGFDGGWSDGSIPFVPPWYCPNGQSYSGGTCGGGTITSGSDPLPTAPHMSLIAAIDGTYYSCLTPIIVPVGVVDADVQFFANDDQLFDNLGSIKFCVNVKNNTQPTFTHMFDFTTGLHGWEVRTTGVTAPYPSYTPGVGIECTNPSGIPGQGLAEIGLNMPGTYNGLVVRYVATVHEDGAGAHGIVNIGAPFDWTSDVEDFPTSDFPDIDLTANFTLPCEALKVNANVSVGVTNVILAVYITGPGEDPFTAF